MLRSRGWFSGLVLLVACSDEGGLPSSPADAGFLRLMDFGVTDADTPDASAMDATRFPDAQVVDSGRGTDSGVPDGGEMDAGVLDIGTIVDAGTMVGVTPDAEGALILSEIMKDPAVLGDAAGEWVEVYNPSTTVTYNLRDCVLSDLGVDQATLPSVVIPPSSFVALARSTNPGFTPAASYTGLILSNGADEVILSCNGTEIDRVEYDDGVEFPDMAGASLSLSANALDPSANDSGASWCAGSSSYNGDLGTPGTENPACP